MTLGEGMRVRKYRWAPKHTPYEEVVDQTEHVSHGQHGYDIVAGRDADGTVAEQHVGHEAAVGKHDPFGESRGARSIIDDGELFR